METKRNPASLAGKNVTVMGLGRFGGGVGVTRWLCGQGARVIVSDKAPAGELGESIAALAGLDVAMHLGGHDEKDFLHTDLVIVNPAVPKDSPLLAAMRQAGVPQTTEINLFIERCVAPIVGITGSVGKSTTTAMVGQLLASKYVTHIGGNIGKSLLDDLTTIRPPDVVVLELSSFQLEDSPLVGISPQVAVVTNLMPNHLDRHGTMDAYGDAKKNIFRYQGHDDVLILNSACRDTLAWACEAPGAVEFFDGDGTGDGVPFELCVPGTHNQANAQAAWTIASLAGIDRPAAAAILKQFTGLPHRLQFVAQRDGVRYYNDSKCTTPQGAIVAINAFPERGAIILVGGYDKHVSFDEMGAALASRAGAVVALGATAGQIAAAVEAHRTGSLPTIVRAEDFTSAVIAAQSLAKPGQTVLLSPACASYDMFTNYEKRGEKFVELVMGS